MTLKGAHVACRVAAGVCFWGTGAWLMYCCVFGRDLLAVGRPAMWFVFSVLAVYAFDPKS